MQDIDVNLATEWLAKSDGEVDGGWGVLITKIPPPPNCVVVIQLQMNKCSPTCYILYDDNVSFALEIHV